MIFSNVICLDEFHYFVIDPDILSVGLLHAEQFLHLEFFGILIFLDSVRR